MKQTGTNWFVYIIQTESGKLYTGITTDLQRRFNEHQQRKKGARFFHLSVPKKVLWTECHPNRSEASKREHEIKQMGRQQKWALITGSY